MGSLEPLRGERCAVVEMFTTTGMVFFAMTENDGGRLSRAARLAGSVTETMRPYCNRPTHKKQRIVAGLKMPNQGCLWNIRFRLRGCLSREGKISNSRDAFKGSPGGCPDLQIRTLMVKKARMALRESDKAFTVGLCHHSRNAAHRHAGPSAKIYRPTAPRRHRGAVQRVGAARSTATFRNLLFHSQSVQDTESAPTGTYQGLIIRFGLGIVAWVWKGNAALGLVAGLTMFLNM